MELMQKYVKEDGAIGVDNLHRWPSNSDALGFLSATTSAASAAELLKVYYFLPPPPKRPTLTVAASTPETSIPEGVTHRHNISGPGLYAWALQVYTTRVIPELAMEITYKSKNLLHYTFAELRNFHLISSFSIYSHVEHLSPVLILCEDLIVKNLSEMVHR